MDEDSEQPTLKVYRCGTCGDTFPKHEGDVVVCPSCGSDDVHDAHEPLL